MNAQYYTEISLGTPAQSVSIFSYSAADILAHFHCIQRLSRQSCRLG